MASLDGMTREELLELAVTQQSQMDDMRHDWDIMNGFVNAQATSFGWCGEYEEALYKFNREFRFFKAQGRVPEGTRVMARNVFAARRLAMGYAMTACRRMGIDVPEHAWGGVVRDHVALNEAHDELIERLKETK